MRTDKIRGNDFHFADWPFYWLTRTGDRYSHHLERALKRIGLDVPRWRVLMQLSKGEHVAVSSIAKHALVKLPTMTKIISRMQNNGLVSCRISPMDARVTEVRITRSGLVARESAWAEAQRVGHAAMVGLSAAKLDVLHRTLDRMFENLASNWEHR